MKKFVLAIVLGLSALIVFAVPETIIDPGGDIEKVLVVKTEAEFDYVVTDFVKHSAHIIAPLHSSIDDHPSVYADRIWKSQSQKLWKDPVTPFGGFIPPQRE